MLVSGNVFPADNPVTVDVNEGLPTSGNFFNPFEVVDITSPTAAEQTEFEFLGLGGELLVGRTSFGEVLISGESAIRSESLVIGDSGVIGGFQGQITRIGTGVVRITGFGSLYNNDPNILPAGLPEPQVFGTKRLPSAGYDVFVGRRGTGTLEISGGGRAEIQDAVVVGDQSTATGTILVDGFDSFLGSGGFQQSFGNRQIGQMIVGRLGTGLMNITMGGQVVSFGRQSMGLQTEPVIAAVIGGNPYNFEGDRDPPEAGGQGVVNVDGPASKWIVGGTLQVGGFHNSDPSANMPDLSGINALYAPNVGRGTLNVSNDALVNLIFPSEQMAGNTEVMQLVIGRFGRVNLNAGRIQLSGGLNPADPNNPDPLVENVHVVNDGVITGTGYIQTGRFRNRVLGQVQVAGGQSLVIDANGGLSTALDPAVPPLLNYGLLDVLGSEAARAELEFVAGPPNQIGEAFINSRLTAEEITALANGGRTFGLVHAQYGTVRFRSGLLNQGQLSFTAGDNIVGGDVLNLGALGNDDALVGQGVITVSGNGTTVVFEDDLTNQGKISLKPNASVMSVLGNFVNTPTGTVSMTLGGGPSGSAISHLTVGGDALLGGTLDVSLLASGANAINPMPGDSYEILSTGGLLSGVFANQLMPILPNGLVMFPVYDFTVGTVTLQVGSFLGAMGADFNGDGVVDLADLAILQMNIGITMGATPLQGDADGDGDVDGQDFLAWQMQLGGPGMPGAGLGNAAIASNVPEPISLVLLLAGLLPATARRRRAR